MKGVEVGTVIGVGTVEGGDRVVGNLYATIYDGIYYYGKM